MPLDEVDVLLLLDGEVPLPLLELVGLLGETGVLPLLLFFVVLLDVALPAVVDLDLVPHVPLVEHVINGRCLLSLGGGDVLVVLGLLSLGGGDGDEGGRVGDSDGACRFAVVE